MRIDTNPFITAIASRALAPVFAVACASSLWAQEPAKITYEDHIKPIFREHCSSCHNNNAKKGGLSLESFQATMAGAAAERSWFPGISIRRDFMR